MKVTLRWLQDFAPFDQSVDVLGDTMSDLGMAVEERWTVGEGFDGIVVAEVLGLRPHPNADRIQLVDVDRGDGSPSRLPAAPSTWRWATRCRWPPSAP